MTKRTSQRKIISDINLRSKKTQLKWWVKHHVSVRGDKIMWGRSLTGEMRGRRVNGGGGEEPDPPESPRVGNGEEEHQSRLEETQDDDNGEEMRAGGDAARWPSLRREDRPGSGQDSNLQGSTYKDLLLILLTRKFSPPMGGFFLAPAEG